MDGEVLRRVSLPRQLGNAHPQAAVAFPAAGSEDGAAILPGGCACVRENNGKVIIDFVSEDEEGEEWADGEGCLSSLISVRADLARGDLRALYLGWLLCVQNEELDDEDQEPPVPPGLGQIDPSLENLAEFLGIDPDLLAVAAKVSPPGTGGGDPPGETS